MKKSVMGLTLTVIEDRSTPMGLATERNLPAACCCCCCCCATCCSCCSSDTNSTTTMMLA